MKKLHLFIALVIFSSFQAKGQTENPTCFCCTEAHKQFDFRIGTSQVFDTTGTPVGENTIVPLQDHCILQENWESKNSTGSSYNYYNATDKSWNQLWVDNRGNPLVLKGNWMEGKMIMRDAAATNAQNIISYNQITWEQQTDGSVSQTWEVFGEQGQRLSLLFKGIYRKK